MTLLSNQQRVGFAESVSATAPTFVFAARDPVNLIINKERYLYEEAGLGRSSYSGMVVEQEGVHVFDVTANMTKSLAFRLITELTGYGNSTSSGANRTLTINASQTAVSIPDYAAVRDIAMFFSNGTTNTRCLANILKASIMGENRGMVTVTFTVAIREPTTSGITFLTVTHETANADKFTNANTQYTITSINGLVQTDISSVNITFDTGLTEHQQKADNKYRMEGGAPSLMIEITSTYANALRDFWRESDPSKGTIEVQFTGSPSVTITGNNMVLNERVVDAPINSVMTNSLTFTSAPYSVSAEIGTFGTTGAPITN